MAMAHNTTSNNNSYLPVAWEYRELVEEQILKRTVGKVFYFGHENTIEEVQGEIREITDEKALGVFIVMDSRLRIRIDRIITFFGKIGPAYEEYNAYADACMDCSGGYTKEELENM